jgi:hypothetical protein
MRNLFIILLALAFIIPNAIAAFPDVPTDYEYGTAVNYLNEQGVIAGYPDGTFGPDLRINRAEFTKIVLGSVQAVDLTPPTAPCFPDVPVNAWYAPFVCAAKTQGIIGGYPDGTFGPAREINLVESAKIVAGAYELPITELQAGQAWYEPFLTVLADAHYLPTSFYTADQAVQRGQFAEIIWRVRTDRQDLSAVSTAEILHPTCQPLNDSAPSNLDMIRIRETVLSWYNAVRTPAGLPTCTANRQLDRTASAWSRAMLAAGKATHQRTPTSSYYDYGEITNWFAEQGVEVKNVHSVTHSENIGSPYYTCTGSDCTDAALAAIRTTFDSYLGEGPGSGFAHSHYNSVFNNYFREIGFGVTVDESRKKLFLTIHYATEITSDPLPVCGK